MKKAGYHSDTRHCYLVWAGFDAFITTEQGRAVSSTPAKKSVDEIAREVIRGDWGNGQNRKNRLTAADYDYDAV